MKNRFNSFIKKSFVICTKNFFKTIHSNLFFTDFAFFCHPLFFSLQFLSLEIRIRLQKITKPKRNQRKAEALLYVQKIHNLNVDEIDSRGQYHQHLPPTFANFKSSFFASGFTPLFWHTVQGAVKQCQGCRQSLLFPDIYTY